MGILTFNDLYNMVMEEMGGGSEAQAMELMNQAAILRSEAEKLGQGSSATPQANKAVTLSPDIQNVIKTKLLQADQLEQKAKAMQGGNIPNAPTPLKTGVVYKQQPYSKDF